MQTQTQGQSREDRIAMALFGWIVAHSPQSKSGRYAAAAVATVVLTLPSLALLAAMLLTSREDTEDWFDALGYFGIFVSNLLSTATVFMPVPGLLAIGHALIVSGAERLSPLLAGLVGGLGMGLGEATAYLTGLVASEAARQTRPEPPRFLRPATDRVIRGVSWLMERYGLPTLFVLAVIPDPVFEFAGLTAGATRIGFRRFMIVVVTGNLIRGLIVAYVGAEIYEAF
jgi:membrane protein DedA with SNARE-associated domain